MTSPHRISFWEIRIARLTLFRFSGLGNSAKTMSAVPAVGAALLPLKKEE